MNFKILSGLVTILLPLVFYSCSSSVEQTREDEVNDESDSTYVFDEIPENDIVTEEYFQVQIGAFTTKQNAENFAAESQKKIKQEISVTYNSEVNLFVVRLDKKFKLKSEAEKVRDQLKKDEEFKDAWVISDIK